MAYTNILIEIANFFDLSLSTLIIQVPTQYTDNPNNSNSVINLMFFQANLSEIDNYLILLDLQYSLNYTLLVIDITINEEFIQDKWHIIIKNSEEEKEFINELINEISIIDTFNISNRESLEKIV